jgi:hypothetical protein
LFLSHSPQCQYGPPYNPFLLVLRIGKKMPPKANEILHIAVLSLTLCS